jgi:hypothetical protein
VNPVIKDESAMIKKETIQARHDARNLRSLSRRALRALDRTCTSLRRRGRDVLEENQAWNGPDASANERLDRRIENAIEPLDACLDEVATRRALAHQREPSKKETRSQRHARKCERVAGRALKVLLAVQEELERGEWADALAVAREGARDLEQRIETLGPSARAVEVEGPAPIAELPETPRDNTENAA